MAHGIDLGTCYSQKKRGLLGLWAQGTASDDPIRPLYHEFYANGLIVPESDP